MNTLTQKIDQLSRSFSSVQADLQKWKTLEAKYNAENMEEDITDVRNTTVSVPMSAIPPVSTIDFVFGETAEIQPDYPTASQTELVSMTSPPSFIDPATRATTGYADFNPSFFTIPEFGEAQGSTLTGIPIGPDVTGRRVQSEEAPHGDENVNVPSGNVTPTGQAPLPPGAQKAISDICDQYLRQLGLNPVPSAYGNTGTANLITSSSPSAPYSSSPSSSGVSNAGGPSPSVIPTSPMSVSSTSPNGEGKDPFPRISRSVNPQPPLTTLCHSSVATQRTTLFLWKEHRGCPYLDIIGAPLSCIHGR